MRIGDRVSWKGRDRDARSLSLLSGVLEHRYFVVTSVVSNK